MAKKVVSIVLAAVLALSLSVCAFATGGDSNPLRFDSNGEFTILNICDIQEKYPMKEVVVEYINEMIDEYKPDIVVLGGDNTVGPCETKAEAIEELCNIFINKQTYFTFVFGNHDNEQDVDKETLLAYYKLYGGKYCLAYDADASIDGVGTHNLPVLASDSDKAAFNLWMFDSNTYTFDENGVKLGYDCVHANQVEWYKATAAEITRENGGVPVPAMAFQHIVVQEVCEELFMAAPECVSIKVFEDSSYSFLPKAYNIKDGLLLEFPCCGYTNFGQFDAFLESGDVIAVFSGHDHVNSYTVTHEGIDIVNTPGASFSSYGKASVRGSRVITIHEDDPYNYDSKVVTIAEQSLKEGSTLCDYKEVNEVSSALAIFGSKLADAIVWAMRNVFFVGLRFIDIGC